MDDKNEIWKRIPSKPGYEASNKGRIRSLDKVAIAHSPSHTLYLRFYPGRVLKQTKDNGYLKTHLGWTHRMVCEAFHGIIPEECSEVNHLNEDKLDNRPENLEWCTSHDNRVYGTRLERIQKTKIKNQLKEQLEKMELIYPGFTDKVLSFFIE